MCTVPSMVVSTRLAARACDVLCWGRASNLSLADDLVVRDAAVLAQVLKA